MLLRVFSSTLTWAPRDTFDPLGAMGSGGHLRVLQVAGSIRVKRNLSQNIDKLFMSRRLGLDVSFLILVTNFLRYVFPEQLEKLYL